ncbi:unnamed protein product [Thlaspi arvense]|uniref:Reverse transcriptase zinc-binding domain-containing protein n=1 Tax=Thlaspi arvense TaxID=13288 RepID=A0AAU9S839_THLAR|nr:unnamed protein product [Thlaspi arvense]
MKPVTFGALLEMHVKEVNKNHILAALGPEWSLLSNYQFSDLGKIWVIYRDPTRVKVLFMDLQLITCEVTLEDGINFIYTAETGLFDLPFNGSKFTWTNNRPSDPIAKKLDRCLVNGTWQVRFPASHCSFESPAFSDHSPCHIRLVIEPPTYGTRPFKFYNLLVKHQKYLLQAEKAEKAMKSLFKENFSDIELRLSDASSVLSSLQILSLNDPSPANLLKESQARDHWLMLRTSEESFFKQRSKIQWMCEGDLNTHFYHCVTTARNTSNPIKNFLKSDGTRTSSLQKAHELAVEYYSSILTTIRGDFCPELPEYLESLNILSKGFCRFSRLLRRCLDNNAQEKITSMFNLKASSLPIRYLGLPLCSKKLSVADCDPLLNQIKQKMSSWTNRFLSMAGGLTLLSSLSLDLWCLLSAQETFQAPFYGMVKRVSRQGAKVAWADISYPKPEGGLGLRHIDTWNDACALKLIYMLFFRAGSIWVAWIKSRYSSYVLKPSVFSASRLVMAIPRFSGEIRGPLLVLSTHTWVQKALHGWESPSLQRSQRFGRVRVGPFLRLDQSDKLCSIPICQGIFALKLPISRASPPKWNAFRQKKLEQTWPPLVRHKAEIPRHQTATWLFILNRNPTLDRSLKWGYDTEGICLLCGLDYKTRDHLFFECSYLAEVWRKLTLKLNITSDESSKLALLQGWQSTIFELWRERNRRFHEGITFNQEKVLKFILTTVKNKCRGLIHMSSSKAAAQSIFPMTEAPPPPPPPIPQILIRGQLHPLDLLMPLSSPPPAAESSSPPVAPKSASASEPVKNPVGADSGFDWAITLNSSGKIPESSAPVSIAESGRPRVKVPNAVFERGVKLHSDYIVDIFYGKPPSYGKIWGVLNFLWGKDKRVTVHNLTKNAFLFHIPSPALRKRVLQHELWRVSDSPFFVTERRSEVSLNPPLLKRAPAWATIQGILFDLITPEGLSIICRPLGKAVDPLRPHHSRTWLSARSVTFGALLEMHVKEVNKNHILAALGPEWSLLSNYQFSDLGKIWVIYRDPTRVKVLFMDLQSITCEFKFLLAWSEAGETAATLKDFCFKLKKLKRPMKSLFKEIFSDIELRVSDASSVLSFLEVLSLNDLSTANLLKKRLLPRIAGILGITYNLLIFLDGTEYSLQGVLSVLSTFEKMSGLGINIQKTFMFCSGLDNNAQERITSLFNLKVSSLPIRYLGLPLCSINLSEADCDPLLAQIKQKLSSWTNRFLSMAGRLTLLSSVISGIVGFLTSTFFLPKKALNEKIIPTHGCFGRYSSYVLKPSVFSASRLVMAIPHFSGGIRGPLLVLSTHTWVQKALHGWESPSLQRSQRFDRVRVGPFLRLDQSDKLCSIPICQGFFALKLLISRASPPKQCGTQFAEKAGTDLATSCLA